MKQMDNNDIENFSDEIKKLKEQSNILGVEKQHIAYMGLHSKMFHESLTSMASIKNDTHEIKQGQSKHNLIVLHKAYYWYLDAKTHE